MKTRIVALLALLVMPFVLASCGSMGLVSKVGEAIEVEKKVEVLAKYRGLENKTVAVVVNAERSVLYEYPTVVPNVAGNIAAGVKEHVSGVQVLEMRTYGPKDATSFGFAAENDGYAFTSDTASVAAKAFGNDSDEESADF